MIVADGCFFKCSMNAEVTRMVPSRLVFTVETSTSSSMTLGIVNLHDASVVDQDVEPRILGDELLCHRGDALRVLKIQLDRDHSRIRLRGCFQMRLPSTA